MTSQQSTKSRKRKVPYMILSTISHPSSFSISKHWSLLGSGSTKCKRGYQEVIESSSLVRSWSKMESDRPRSGYEHKKKIRTSVGMLDSRFIINTAESCLNVDLSLFSL